MHNVSSKKGFTLAEILLTLAIIGTVAAMTVPALLQTVSDMEFRVAYKQAFSDADQAVKLTKENYNYPCACERAQCTGIELGSPNGFNTINFGHFKSAFIVSKDCMSDYRDCWSNDEVYVWAGHTYPELSGNDKASAFVDNKGRSWLFRDGNCLSFVVDVNGLKKPNQMGKDRFPIGVYPPTNATTPYPSFYRAAPGADYTSSDAYQCPKGNCYFTKWLKE